MNLISGLLIFFAICFALAGGADKSLMPVAAPGFAGCLMLGGVAWLYGNRQ